MSAYYNEIDPYAAQWLRNLIDAGHIAPGDVDERDIRDIRPDELVGYTQCHFFAGIGVWSHALRVAGWPDDREVWTGSCPCQPFSAAGRGAGVADERHLWPHWFHLIEARRPAVILGEQVASKDGLAWLDLVQADMEGAGYAFGAVDICAASVGAPHIRQRLYLVGVADAASGRSGPGLRNSRSAEQRRPVSANDSAVGGMADAASARPLSGALGGVCGGEEGAGPRDAEPQRPRSVGGLVDALGAGLEGQFRHGDDGDQPGRLGTDAAGPVAEAGDAGGLEHAESDGRLERRAEPGGRGATGGRGALRPGPVNGQWGASDWLFCRDGRWRAVEPGTFPLAHRAPARVGRLRAYGNAIVAPLAAAFVEAVTYTIGGDLA